MARILIVEDNEDNLDMLLRRLQRRGFEIVVAMNGAEGVEMAQQHLPDVILMDIDLPIMDGLEATRRIKAAPDTGHIPVVALTANAMVGDMERTLAAGCDAYEAKPVDMPHLLDTIARMLNGKA
ncbi:MAG: response regulator [Anaerolineae bacterium]|nr:response regulator [Anaerolineae bacterium]